MKTILNLNNGNLLLLAIMVILLAPACKKDSCNADFSSSFSNGGMTPEVVTVTASTENQDSYTWTVNGLSDQTGTPAEFTFNTVGVFDLELSVRNGDASCDQSDVIDIRNYPYQGFVSQSGNTQGRALSYFESNGTLNTVIFDAENAEPIIIPEGQAINIDGTGGLDYDDANQTLYMTPNFPGGGATYSSCFPNGAEFRSFTGEDDFGITDLIVDDENQVLYYSTRFGGNAIIRKVDLNTGELLSTFNNLGVLDIYFALDRSTNDIYWTAAPCIGKIDGTIMQGNSNFFCANEGDDLGAMIFDNSKGVLYFTQVDFINESFAIYLLDLTLEEPNFTLLVEDASDFTIQGLALDEENQELFWSSGGDNTIKKLNLDTGEIEIVVENVSRPRALVVGIFTD